MQRKLKGADKWKIGDNFPGTQSVFLDSGAFTLNREDAAYTQDEARELSERYMAFVQQNVDSASMVSEFDAQIMGHDYIQAMRDDFYNTLPAEKFMPVWHSEYGRDELEKLAANYDIVGIRQHDATESDLTPLLNSLASQYNVRFHGAAITGKESMKKSYWYSVSSTSWLSPSMYGDTIIWIDRDKELRRFPKDYKSSRKQHRTMLNDLGFDSEAIENDDSAELLRLSIWSWNQFVDYINESRVTSSGGNRITANQENTGKEVDTLDSESGTERSPAFTRTRETVLIPTIGIASKTTKDTDPDGIESEHIETFTITRSESMRACNTCFLRQKCVAFEPGANCAYNIPIEVRTTDQLRALQAALVEMQAQRVLFMKLAEDIEGGYADPNLSSEMDRLQRMLKSKAESEREGFSLKIEATGTDGAPGYFSRMFGNNAGEKLAILEKPITADDLIKNSDLGEIVDGEIVS